MADRIERIAAYLLRPGDVLSGTGRTVLSVSAGVRTPRGKVEVFTEHPARGVDSRRCDIWGKHTRVGIVRPQAEG